MERGVGKRDEHLDANHPDLDEVSAVYGSMLAFGNMVCVWQRYYSHVLNCTCATGDQTIPKNVLRGWCCRICRRKENAHRQYCYCSPDPRPLAPHNDKLSGHPVKRSLAFSLPNNAASAHAAHCHITMAMTGALVRHAPVPPPFTRH